MIYENIQFLYINIDTCLEIAHIYLTMETFSGKWEQNFPKLQSDDMNQNSE